MVNIFDKAAADSRCTQYAVIAMPRGRLQGVNCAGGALITAIEPQGPAARILRAGDVLLSIGSKSVTFDGLGKITASLRPGTTVEAMVQRDGQQLSIPLKTGSAP